MFELRADDKDALISYPKSDELDASKLAQIAKYVAANGQVNINKTEEREMKRVKRNRNFF